METSMLADLSNALQQLTERSRGRVVCVGAGKAAPRSGLIIGNGELVTVARAAEEGEPVPVHMGDLELEATVAGYDPASGIALLTHPEFAHEQMAAGSLPAVGSLTVTIACPIPGDHEARLGLIRCVGGPTRLGGGRQIANYFQTDAVRFRGFAGSVVFGPAGEVLGLSMPTHRREESFAIPTEDMLQIVDQLREGKSMGTGYLGIQATAVDLPDAHPDFTQGLLVTGVETGSPAERAGVVVGNFIVQVGDRKTPDLESLFDALVGLKEGSDLSLSLLKPGGDVEVRMAEVKLRK